MLIFELARGDLLDCCGFHLPWKLDSSSMLSSSSPLLRTAADVAGYCGQQQPAGFGAWCGSVQRLPTDRTPEDDCLLFWWTWLSNQPTPSAVVRAPDQQAVFLAWQLYATCRIGERTRAPQLNQQRIENISRITRDLRAIGRMETPQPAIQPTLAMEPEALAYVPPADGRLRRLLQ